MKLVIGNKTYSSWSLRPWLAMKHFGISFEEVLIKLDLPDTTENIKKYSPAARVPVLIDGDLHVWESVAILEYLNEKFPQKKMYPENAKGRAIARSLVQEMHAGFGDLRQHLSFNTKKKYTNFDASPAQKDIDRIFELWRERLSVSNGPFLFGRFTLADAMYAPVVGRFVTYGIQLHGPIKEYCDAVMNLSAMRDWYQGAEAEDFVAQFHP